ncbi:MAG: YjfB family protein [Lachnospiraceae bacterium]|nr:YjfB family protein [Lachnospiraceae bacterium]
MDIPALSMAMAQSKIETNVGIAVMKKNLDMAEEQGAELIKMMERSVTPSVGGNIDVRV